VDDQREPAEKRTGKGVISARWSPAWARRGLLVGVLVGAALIPGYASGSAAPRHCTGYCGPGLGVVRWIQPLTGSWTAQSGVVGTVPAVGQAYVAAGPQLAVLGYGMNVYAYDAATGTPMWAATLTGFPAGASIVSVRSWPGVVTAGVAFAEASGKTVRDEVVLAPSGQQLRTFPAAAYGGAIEADAARTVIVGTTAVTSYDNATGRAVWSRPTGAVQQAWRVDGSYLYVTVAAAGYVGAAPVTKLRQIDLVTGAERMIRPPHGSFPGALSAAFDGVLLFSDTTGITAYSEAIGQWLWQRAGTVPQSEDLVSQTLYVTHHSGLTGVDPQTGTWVKRSSIPGSSGLYGVRDGVALGLDQGALGDAWGYDISLRRVIWTTPPVPWPHYFVDLSGIGGSADPSSNTVLLAACAGLGGTGPAKNGHVCLRPELVAIRR
jgi:outer membrane protein assembly factor BamB